ncbi:MAG: hypothetical protein OEM52_03115 [bacterium]|nr:hypothetical protein [bacterium]
MSDSKFDTNVTVPLRHVRCPVCDTAQIAEGDDYLATLRCGACQCSFRYLDGYLWYFHQRPESFVTSDYVLPLVPGFTVGGELLVEPNEIYQIQFTSLFGKPPEVLFLTGSGGGIPDLLRDNLYISAFSVKPQEFLILTRIFDRTRPAKSQLVRWMAIGELKIDREKPLWLIYLDNAVELIRKDELRAAVVILLIALDFFYDEQLSEMGITYEEVRARGRRPGMNEKKAKLQLLQEQLGEFPLSLQERLRDVTDYRNRIVHPIVRRSEVLEVPPNDAFVTILSTVQTVLSRRYRKGAIHEKV